MIGDEPSEVRYLDLAAYLLVAEEQVDIPAEKLQHVADLNLADSALHAPQAGFGDVEFSPDLFMKAAVLCSHLAKNHALPDGNKRVAFHCTLLFLNLNGLYPHLEQHVAAELVVGLVDGTASETDFADYLRSFT